MDDNYFDSLFIQDIEKTLSYYSSSKSNSLYNRIFSELRKIDEKIEKIGSQNFKTDKAYYCIRTSNEKNLAFGSIPKKLREDVSAPLYLILKTNKGGDIIKIHQIDQNSSQKYKDMRSKSGSFNYTDDEDEWKKMAESNNDKIEINYKDEEWKKLPNDDRIVEKIIELLR